MGSRVLLSGVALAAMLCAGCVPNDAGRPVSSSENSHATLACAVCHQGEFADRSLASVPPATCTASGCHERDLPGEVFLETVRFEHRSHGSTADLAVGCAGCHTHKQGGEPITGSAETCGLCHQDELAGPRGDPCRTCHVEPNHVGLTSQGLEVPHAGLPWVERGCLRCHYEVAEPLHEIPIDRCATCHIDGLEVQRQGVGLDLHPSHVSVSCQSCHDPDAHRIQSMSSAVNLECADCHASEHGVEIDPSWPAASTCIACHQDVHEAEQATLLGLVPGARSSSPAEHFMDGLTCRSCHAAGSANGGPPARDGKACSSCHLDEYRVIARWWEEGVTRRFALVDRYMADAGRAVVGLPEGDPARAELTRARERLDRVRAGGGEHNLPLTHAIFLDALSAGAAGYAAVGRSAPTAPSLGRPPRSGFCSYCHYQIDGLGLTEDMPEDFHRGLVVGR